MKTWITLGGIAVFGAVGYFFFRASRFGAESIPYQVRMKDARFELRDYPALPVARTAINGGTGDDSFAKLFRFITGNNARAEKIAMTTPVFIDGPIGAQTSMSFGVPAETQARGVPVPKASAVEISQRPSCQIAAVRYSGPTRETSERKAISELRAWMAARNLEAEGEPIIAYYDAPFLPGPFRRNEAMLRVRNRADGG